MDGASDVYRQLVEMSPDAVMLDVNGVTTFANAAAARLLGTDSPADLVGRPPTDWVDERFLEGFAAARATLLAGPVTLPPIETQIRRFDGTLVPIEVLAASYEVGGQLVVQGICRDLTERKLAEQALSASVARFDAANRATGEVIWDWDLGSGLISWNANFGTMFGWLPDDIEPTIVSWTSRLDPAEAEAVIAHLEGALAGTDETWQASYRFRRKDGSYADVVDRGVVLRDADGVGVRMIGTLRDVTDLNRAAEQLRNERDYAEAVIASLPGVFYHYDDQARLVRWNRNFEIVSGYTAEELRGVHVLEFITEGQRDAVQEAVDEVMGAGESAVEAFLRSKDGTLTPFVFTGVRFEHAGEFGFVGVGTDLTARRRMENELREFNVQLEQRVADRTAELRSVNDELESFCYSVSHDLRSPLRAISGFTEILNQEYGDQLEGPAQGYLRRVLAATARMGELIDDLLQLSRVTRDEMTHVPVDLSSLFRDIVAALQYRSPGRGVNVAIEDAMTAVGDPRLIRIAFENLIDNAWKFTGNTEHPCIDISRATTPDGAPAVAVRDNGAGFDMRYAGKLFTPFQRLHRLDEFPGTGIGLATVQRIVNRHGGSISVTASPNQGATFVVSLGRGEP